MAEPGAQPSTRGRVLGLLGLVISLAAIAGVVIWALHQDRPHLPSSPKEVAYLVLAVVIYAINTAVRGERWHRLLVDDGASPTRTDSYALTVVGYAGNNVLPARAGDAFRVFLMAPRAATTRRNVIGTLVAERLLDIAVILILFVVVGYAVLGNVSGGDLGIVLAVSAALAIAAGVGILLVRRNERITAAIAPMLSSTLRLRQAHHGLRLGAMSVGIWVLEAAVWWAVGGAIGFGMTPIEALYLVAIASIAAMIPSGPAYAGTQDAAAIIGIKAIGGSGATAVSYLLMLRFVLVVPITLAGIVLVAARYGGVRRLRASYASAE